MIWRIKNLVSFFGSVFLLCMTSYVWAACTDVAHYSPDGIIFKCPGNIPRPIPMMTQSNRYNSCDLLDNEKALESYLANPVNSVEKEIYLGRSLTQRIFENGSLRAVELLLRYGVHPDAFDTEINLYNSRELKHDEKKKLIEYEKDEALRALLAYRACKEAGVPEFITLDILRFSTDKTNLCRKTFLRKLHEPKTIFGRFKRKIDRGLLKSSR
jgi:hypothetical protein